MYRYSLKEIHQILQNITDGVLILDNDGIVLYVNKGAEKFFGKKRSELLNRDFWSTFSVPQESIIYKKFKLSLKEKINVRINDYSKVLDKWVDGMVYPHEQGIIAIFRDVTGQVQHENKIIEDHRNFFAIINNTSDAIWLLDKDLNIIVANNIFYKTTKDSTNITISGKIDLAKFNDAVREQWEEYYNNALLGKPTDHTDEIYIHGETRFYRHIVKPVFENEEVIAINCQSRDVTERVLRVRKIEAQNKLLSEIAHNQSHSLRRPIATILGLLELLEPDEIIGTENYEILKNLKYIAQETDAVIKDYVKVINKIEKLEQFNY